LVFSDTTCTAPYLLETKGGEQPFLTAEFTDGGPTGPERTLSGYVEVMEMGNLTGPAAAAATHTSAAVPPPSGSPASNADRARRPCRRRCRQHRGACPHLRLHRHGHRWLRASWQGQPHHPAEPQPVPAGR